MSLSKNINPSLVLVQPRKTRPFITERLLMGCKELNKQTVGPINYDVLLSLKAVLILANCADPDKMNHSAFHLGLHFLPKYPFMSFQYTFVQRVD